MNRPDLTIIDLVHDKDALRSRSPNAANDYIAYRFRDWTLIVADGLAWWSSPSYAVWFLSIGAA